MSERGETFGQLVRRLRKARRWTQTELGHAATLDQSTISAVELDRGEPTATTVRRLADVFGGDPHRWAQLAGLLPLPAEVVPPRVPAEEPTGDGDWDPAALVPWVLAHPDKKFVARLERLAERVPPEAFERICIKIARAWLANGVLAVELAEEFIDAE